MLLLNITKFFFDFYFTFHIWILSFTNPWNALLLDLGCYSNVGRWANGKAWHWVSFDWDFTILWNNVSPLRQYDIISLTLPTYNIHHLSKLFSLKTLYLPYLPVRFIEFLMSSISGPDVVIQQNMGAMGQLCMWQMVSWIPLSS